MQEPHGDYLCARQANSPPAGLACIRARIGAGSAPRSPAGPANYLELPLPLRRALDRCFLPGGPPELPRGVLESPGFFCLAMPDTLRSESLPGSAPPGRAGLHVADEHALPRRRLVVVVRFDGDR